MPYPDPDENSGWDRGLEVIPAGYLATQHINNSPDILRGEKLELINIDSGACASSSRSPLGGFVDLFNNVSTSKLNCVFGVIGLYCSSVTNVIAPLLSHPKFGYIQLTSSTAPLLRNTKLFPYLFSVVSSSDVYSSAVIEMMAEFNWKRISVVYDFDEISFRSTGQNFAKLIRTTPELNLIADIPITKASDQITRMFKEIVQRESRVNYFAVTIEESGRIMCEAFQNRSLWPGYVYIFFERNVSQIISYNKTCSKQDMLSAIEGIFILQYRLFVNNNAILLSGKTYQSYYDGYLEALDRYASKTKIELKENEYANTLYDQVWAFALAMNNSMDKIDTSINDSFKNIINFTPEIRRILAEQLRMVSFQGVSGAIRFNERQEVQTSVEIYQVQKGQQVLIGMFDSKIGFLDDFDKQSMPKDSFSTEFYVAPLWLRVPVLILQVLLFTMLLMSAIALIYWRKKPEVKSTSLFISFVILIGCLLMCVSPILTNIFTKASVFTALCNVDLWFSLNGISIVVVALLFRLLRIVHVFRSFHSTGKYWSDTFMLLYIGLTSCIMVMLLLVWTAVDHVKLLPKPVYQSSARPPFYLNYMFCSSNHLEVWLGLSYAWIALLLVVVLFLAIKTRHIKHKHFKDTKKVNAFIFSICIIFSIFIPLSRLLEVVNIVIGAYIFKWLSYFTIVFMCQLLLFLPKYAPLIYANCDRGRTISSSHTFKSHAYH